MTQSSYDIHLDGNICLCYVCVCVFRLWGDHGQEALENAHVCLINATATGTEILKNLVLPGKRMWPRAVMVVMRATELTDVFVRYWSIYRS